MGAGPKRAWAETAQRLANITESGTRPEVRSAIDLLARAYRRHGVKSRMALLTRLDERVRGSK